MGVVVFSSSGKRPPRGSSGCPLMVGGVAGAGQDKRELQGTWLDCGGDE